MAFDVITTAVFNEWFGGLTAAERETVDTLVNLLKDKGPMLGRPYADTLKGSVYPNMKELRAAHKKDSSIRIAFAFDPNRNALLLIGGDKHAARGFYTKLLRTADELYATHLDALKRGK